MGFQDMPEEKRKEVARKGAEASKSSGGGFQNMSEEKRKKAAKKGGERSHGGGRPKGS